MALKKVTGLNFRIAHEPTTDKDFLPKGRFSVLLDYPLDKVHKFDVKGPMTVEQLCVRIAQEYKEVIYADCEKFGVWGHCIEDLYIESLTLKADGDVNVGVGS